MIRSPQDSDTNVTPLDPARPARRVLLISLVFPPTGGPGTQRTAKFAKYLGEFGWRPVVWSASTMKRLPTDPALADDLPRDLTHHTRPAWEPEHLLDADRPGARPGAALARRLILALSRAGRYLVPDDQIIWALRSLAPLIRLVHRERIDAIVTSYSPPSVHLLGWSLKTITRRPWVADFRDLWTDDYSFDRAAATWPGAHRWLEQRLLQRADAVVGVTPAQTALLASHVPAEPHKFVTIRNGVDLDDFKGVDRAAARARLGIDHRRFNVTYTGWFLTRHYAPGLAEGLARFVSGVRERQGEVDVRFVGNFSDEARRRFGALGVDVMAPGYQSHRVAVEHMVAADALLLPVPTTGMNALSTVPGKLYEYLAAGRPILLIGPPGGEPERILERCDAGVRVPSSADAVCRQLQAWWTDWRAGRLRGGCRREALAPYVRRNLTARLATLLDSLAAAPAEPASNTRDQGDASPWTSMLMVDGWRRNEDVLAR